MHSSVNKDGHYYTVISNYFALDFKVLFLSFSHREFAIITALSRPDNYVVCW